MTLKLFTAVQMYLMTISAIAHSEEDNFFESSPCGNIAWSQEEAIQELADHNSSEIRINTQLFQRRRRCTDSEGCPSWEPPFSMSHTVGYFGHSTVKVSLGADQKAHLMIEGDFIRRPEWLSHQPGDPLCYLGLGPMDQGYDRNRLWNNFRDLGIVGQQSYSFTAKCGNGTSPLQFTGVVAEGCVYLRSSVSHIAGSSSRWYQAEWVSVSK